MTIMKAKYAWVALLAITFFGCDDNTAGLGLDMFPGSDQGINGKLTTFDVTTNSVPTGDIYAKTNIGYVGKFTDETFGTYQAGFLATLNCPQYQYFEPVYQPNSEDTKATGSMVTDFAKIGLTDKEKERFFVIEDESGKAIGNCQINIYLWYSSYFGDSLTAHRMSIYQLEKPLDSEKAYYTNINPEEYYNTTNNPILLGTKAYTAVDLSVKDSIRNLSSYVPSVNLRLNESITKKLGSELLHASQTDPTNFYKKFRELFPGIYVKSDYGDGTVLYVNQVQMDIVSICYVTDSITGLSKKSVKYPDKDSIRYTGRSFTSTREVIQANQLQNDPQKIAALIAEGTNTYLKTPAGIFTQATLPITDIQKQLEGDTLNAVKLTFSNYNQTGDKKFGMSIPTNVMLIRKKEVDTFFKKNQLSDGISSFLASHSSSANQYTFSNITKLINACMAEKEKARKDAGSAWDETAWLAKDENKDWDKVVLIPVLVTTDSSSSSSSGTPNIISIQHDLKPGYVRLKGGSYATDPSQPTNVQDKYKLKLEVVSTNFGSK